MYTWKTIMRSIVIKLIYKDLSVIEGEDQHSIRKLSDRKCRRFHLVSNTGSTISLYIYIFYITLKS